MSINTALWIPLGFCLVDMYHIQDVMRMNAHKLRFEWCRSVVATAAKSRM